MSGQAQEWKGRRQGLGEVEVQRIWKDYIEDLYNIDTQEQVALMVFREVPILEESQLRDETEARVRKLRNIGWR